MSTDQDDSITDEPDDAPSAPPVYFGPSKLDQALKARGPQRIPGPPAVPKSRIIERPPVDMSGAALESTPNSSGFDPLGFARDAIDAARKDWETIRQSAADIGNDSITLAKLTKPVLDRALRRLQDAEQKAEQRFAHHNTEIYGTLHMKVSDSRAAEIRAFFRAKGKSAMTAMHAALQDTGDYDTVSAILGAPAYLSGITREQQNTFETLAELRLTPEGVRDRRQADKARATLKRMRERMQKEIGARLPSWAGESGSLKALRLAAAD